MSVEKKLRFRWTASRTCATSMNCCGWHRTAIGCLFGLSFVNLFILPPALIFVHDSHVAPGIRPSSLRLPPFPEASVRGWRRVRDRHGHDDLKWARRILRNVWCSPSAEASQTAWNASVKEVAALLPGRAQLDRRIARMACIQACDEARLQWVADTDADGTSADRTSYRHVRLRTLAPS